MSVSLRSDLYYCCTGMTQGAIHRSEIFSRNRQRTRQRLSMHTPQPTPSEDATRQFTALVVAGLALGGPLVGMALVGFGRASYTPSHGSHTPLAERSLIGAGGAAVGCSATVVFFGGICGYLLPSVCPT